MCADQGCRAFESSGTGKGGWTARALAKTAVLSLKVFAFVYHKLSRGSSSDLSRGLSPGTHWAALYPLQG